jgi:hypothetical protein
MVGCTGACPARKNEKYPHNLTLVGSVLLLRLLHLEFPCNDGFYTSCTCNKFLTKVEINEERTRRLTGAVTDF